MEPIFCIPTSGSANSVRSAYDPGSRPRGLSLEPNGILSTRFRSNSTPRYVIYYSVGPNLGTIFTFGLDKLRPLAVGRSRSRMKVFHKQSNIESIIMDLILDLKTNVHYLIHNLN